MIRDSIKECLQKLKRHMIALTYSFYPVEKIFDNMIAPKDGDLYKSVVQKVFNAPKAFERLEAWRDLYSKH